MLHIAGLVIHAAWIAFFEICFVNTSFYILPTLGLLFLHSSMLEYVGWACNQAFSPGITQSGLLGKRKHVFLLGLHCHAARNKTICPSRFFRNHHAPFIFSLRNHIFT